MNGLMLARRLALALIIAAVPFASALAGEFATVINGKSFHLGASQNWNEDNVGLGFEYQLRDSTRWKPILMANGFRDSNDAMSYVAGAGLHRNLLSTRRLSGLYLDAGLNAFVMTREDVNGNRPFPGILPSVTLGNRYAGINLTYLPKTAVEKAFDQQMRDDSIKGIIFLQFKIAMSPGD